MGDFISLLFRQLAVIKVLYRAVRFAMRTILARSARALSKTYGPLPSTRMKVAAQMFNEGNRCLDTSG
jgi:hypothetical protein